MEKTRNTKGRKHKTKNKMAEVLPYTIYFKSNRLKLSKQKTKLGQMSNKQAKENCLFSCKAAHPVIHCLIRT